jgi:hypothetical protein
MTPDFSDRRPDMPLSSRQPEFRQLTKEVPDLVEYAVPEARLTQLLAAEARLKGEKGLERFMYGALFVGVLLALIAGITIGTLA